MDASDFTVCPFRVVVDTREQAPWHFRGITADAKDGGGPMLVQTVEATLQTGDYSIEGLEHVVTVERKSHADLLGSVSHGRRRFQAEFERMAGLEFAAVVVEASMAEILHAPPRHSKMHPKAVIRTAISWSIRYPNVHWWFPPSRNAAEQLCFRILQQFWRIHSERQAAL